MFRANNYDKLLDKATSNLRLDPDWPTILQICDLIRQNDCTPKYAVAAIKKKLYSQNPHQAMFALLTLESVVKNCGSGVHDEVASKAFCEMLRDLVKTTQHENLRTKILELIQAWAFAFRNTQKYRAVQDTVNILKAEGFKFPPLKESDAMFSADTAPEWADGEVCHRCRVAFSLIVRRHHCRACGQVFCQQCSSKTSTLPKFGIEKEVRVCDACFDKVSRPPTSSAKLDIVDTSNDYGPTQGQKRPPGGKTAEELQEEEELQLALALSQSEAEQKEKERRTRSHIAPDPTPHHNLSPTPSSVSASPEHSTTTNTELSRYLDRNYWEQRLARDSAPTAPLSASSDVAETNHDYAKPLPNKSQDDDAEDKEIDEFVESLKSQVEIFVNRMKSNSSRGRSIANDTSVQTLFMNITAMHSRLLRYIQQQDDKRVYLESLQDKVNQVRDSRAALDTLRAEHAARLAAQAEAAERQRQMQMAAKLQAMRKKKHEYLQYQRQLALQRVQEQEREMQMRQEQQKHQYLMSANSYYLPGVSMHQFQPGYPNQPMYANPQFIPQMMPQVSTTDGTMSLPGQPQMSQANMSMMNQLGALSQSMPQLSNTYTMTTSGMAISQPQAMNSQQAINQSNIRAAMNPPVQNLQQQMMLQQMHQMRLSAQPGMHQMIPGNIANGLPGQNQQNGQSKQNQPPITTGQQQNIGQPIGNPSNPMLSMQMQNMRMPMMQGNQSNSNQSGYPINMQNQLANPSSTQQPGSLPANMQQPSQMLPGQPMSLPSQQMLPSHSLPSQANIQMANHLPPTSQSMILGTQVPHTQGQQQPSQQQMQQQQMQQQQLPQQQLPQQQLPQQQINQQQVPQQQLPQQQMPQQQMSQQQMPQQLPQQQMPQQQIPQQQMPQQQMPQQQIPQQQMSQQQLPSQQMQQQQLPQQQMPMQGQPIPPGQPMMVQGQQMLPQGQNIPQNQQMMNQGPQMQASQMQMPSQVPISQMQMPSQIIQGQLPQNIAGQPMKVQSQNMNAPQQGQTPANPNQQNQQAQTPKSEHNNNTAELISFD